MKFTTSFMAVLVMVLTLFACEDQVIENSKPTVKPPPLKAVANQCEQRQIATFEELADIGIAFHGDWYGGELDRLLRYCEVGLIQNCQNFQGTEEIQTCCFSLFNFDLDHDEVFRVQEQDAVLDFIMESVAAFEPECSDATLIAIDVFRIGALPLNIGFAAKYMCCGHDEF